MPVVINQSDRNKIHSMVMQIPLREEFAPLSPQMQLRLRQDYLKIRNELSSSGMLCDISCLRICDGTCGMPEPCAGFFECNGTCSLPAACAGHEVYCQKRCETKDETVDDIILADYFGTYGDYIVVRIYSKAEYEEMARYNSDIISQMFTRIWKDDFLYSIDHLGRIINGYWTHLGSRFVSYYERVAREDWEYIEFLRTLKYPQFENTAKRPSKPLTALSDSLKTRIGRDYDKFTNTNPNDNHVARYLGMYNGRAAVVMHGPWVYLTIAAQETVADFTFHYPHVGPFIKIWDNGEFYRLGEAFDKGLITVDDVRDIYYYWLIVRQHRG
jgi:hypothetical protein